MGSVAAEICIRRMKQMEQQILADVLMGRLTKKMQP